jgi:hypothetical protein
MRWGVKYIPIYTFIHLIAKSAYSYLLSLGLELLWLGETNNILIGIDSLKLGYEC